MLSERLLRGHRMSSLDSPHLSQPGRGEDLVRCVERQTAYPERMSVQNLVVREAESHAEARLELRDDAGGISRLRPFEREQCSDFRRYDHRARSTCGPHEPVDLDDLCSRLGPHGR